MMRSHLFLLLVVAAASACVKGNPDKADGGAGVYKGGTITPEGCSYTVTTRVGAEAPQVAPSPAEVPLGPDPTPKQVRLGFGGDPKTSIAIQWRTADETTEATTVNWGEGAALDHTTTGLTFVYLASVSGTGQPIRMHETHLCGLKPDTQYSYQAGTDGHFSPTYTFRTAPDVTVSPDAELVIGVIGDSRGGFSIEKTLVDQVASRTPDLLLFSGDAVTLGPLQSEWDQFFDALEPLVQS